MNAVDGCLSSCSCMILLAYLQVTSKLKDDFVLHKILKRGREQKGRNMFCMFSEAIVHITPS